LTALDVRDGDPTDTDSEDRKALLRRLFDLFSANKFTGHGLGLAAALGIVRRHGGAIRVRSRQRAGPAFQVL
jgi:two-component system cell cycle sensor histidine kinase/response regulator CckA